MAAEDIPLIISLCEAILSECPHRKDDRAHDDECKWCRWRVSEQGNDDHDPECPWRLAAERCKTLRPDPCYFDPDTGSHLDKNWECQECQAWTHDQRATGKRVQS